MAVPIRRVRRFHGRRILFWVAIGAAVQAAGKTDSVTILFWISMAALIESAATDYMNARQLERENPTAEL